MRNLYMAKLCLNESIKLTMLEKANELCDLILNKTKYGKLDKEYTNLNINNEDDYYILSSSEFEKYKVGTCFERALFLQSKLNGDLYLFDWIESKSYEGHCILISNDTIIDPSLKRRINKYEYPIKNLDSLQNKLCELYEIKEILNIKKIKATEIIHHNLKDVILNLNLPNAANKYDPPYNEDQIKKKYGMLLYDKLSKDPVHLFRMKTGIELIHKEPTIDEFLRITSNWLAMPKQLQNKSDSACRRILGLDNLSNFYKVLMTYYEN